MTVKIKVIDQRTGLPKTATIHEFRLMRGGSVVYKLDNGSIIELTPELLQIASLDDEFLPNGDPIYQFGMNTKVEFKKKEK